jgi:hypothetical protein
MTTTQNLDASTQRQYEKIAAMALHGFPQTAIAEACALSDGRISQIMSDPAYQAIYAAKAADAFEEQQLRNQGWDAVEDRALSVVVKNLEWNKDPEFALKAAMIANKANRRGSLPGAAPLYAAQAAGARVVINLQQKFVTKLTAPEDSSKTVNAEATEIAEGLAGRKVTNVLGVNSIRDMFTPRDILPTISSADLASA